MLNSRAIGSLIFFFLGLVYVTGAFYAFFFKTPSGVYNSTKNKKFSLAHSPFSLKVKIGRQLLMVVISNGAIVKKTFCFRHLFLLETNPFDGVIDPSYTQLNNFLFSRNYMQIRLKGG